MRRIAIVALLVAAGCSSLPSGAIREQLKNRDTEQKGPKILVRVGKLPNGLPWNFLVHRRKEKQICWGLAWLEPNANSYAGTCTPDEGATNRVQATYVFPRLRPDRPDLRYVAGAVTPGGRPVFVRLFGGPREYRFRLFSHPEIPELLFYVGHLDEEAAQTLQLLDASGNAIYTTDFRA